MTSNLLSILASWAVTRRGAVVRRVVSPMSFSGAEVYRVTAGGREFALRRWPREMDGRRLRRIHDFQARVAASGPPVIPALMALERTGATFASRDGWLWELASWMPGQAEDSAEPRLERLRAALRTLAEVHQASRARSSVPWTRYPDRKHGPTPGVSKATTMEQLARSLSMQRRVERLSKLIARELGDVHKTLTQAHDASDRELVQRCIQLAAAVAPRQRHRAQACAASPLPQQDRLGDARREHFLFTDDEVTGIVDFGAADFDSPAGDVARLLGGFAGDDRQRWAAGLAAYEDVRPLTDAERQAVEVFDSTGTVIATFNWVRWLFGSRCESKPIAQREAGLARLRQLATRLEVLAAG